MNSLKTSVCVAAFYFCSCATTQAMERKNLIAGESGKVISEEEHQRLVQKFKHLNGLFMGLSQAMDKMVTTINEYQHLTEQQAEENRNLRIINGWLQNALVQSQQRGSTITSTLTCQSE